MKLTSMLGAITCCIGLIFANQAAAQPLIPEVEQLVIRDRLDYPYESRTVNNVTRDWTANLNFACKVAPGGCLKKPLIIVLHGNETNANVAILSNRFPDEFRFHGMNAQTTSGTCEVNTILSFFTINPVPVTQICKEFRLDNDATVEDDGNAIVAYIERAKQDSSIDPKRIYVFGESGGGFVLLRNLCKLAGKVAAVGINAALPRDVDAQNWVSTTSCSPGVNIPYIHIHGTADPSVNFTGISANDSLNMDLGPKAHVGVAKTIENMRTRHKTNSFTIQNHANSSTEVPTNSTVTSTTYYKDKLPLVKLVKVVGGGHAMPGLLHHLPKTQALAISYQQAVLGPVNLDIVGATQVADFFKLHKLN